MTLVVLNHQVQFKGAHSLIGYLDQKKFNYYIKDLLSMKGQGERKSRVAERFEDALQDLLATAMASTLASGVNSDPTSPSGHYDQEVLELLRSNRLCMLVSLISTTPTADVTGD